MSAKVQIEFLTKNTHKKECVDISNTLFGENYLDLSYFNATEIIRIIALKNKEVIGFFTAQKINDSTIKINSIGIKTNYQKKLIGTRLMSFFFGHYVNKKTKVIAQAWKSKYGVHAGKLNFNFGMKIIENQGKIWKKTCNKTFKCPYYKTVCSCEGILFST